MYYCARPFPVWLSSESMSPSLLLARINFDSLFRLIGVLQGRLDSEAERQRKKWF